MSWTGPSIWCIRWLSVKTSFLVGSEPDGLTRREMIPLYSRSSVTLDDFGAGWYGSIVVEASACECPVVTYVEEDFLERRGRPPLLIAKTPEVVAMHLQRVWDDPLFAQEVDQGLRGWVADYHSTDAVCRAYQDVISKAGRSSQWKY